MNHIPRFGIPCSFQTKRPYRFLSLLLCVSFLVTSVMPTPQTNARNVATGQSSAIETFSLTPISFGLLLIRKLLILVQGGPPSVPGANLPDLDAARQIPFAEPVMAPPIASEVACQDCQPCPGCTNNNPPVAVAGGPYNGNTSDPVRFNGSASFDPDGDLITYQWNFGDGGTATGPSPIHVYTTQGTFNVTVTVTDSQGSTDQGTTTASVAAPPAPTPTPPPPGPGNAAVFVSQNVPTEVGDGQTASVSVRMRNSGSTTWTAARLYRLGSQNPQDNSTWGMGRVYLPHDVAPGSEVSFNFAIIGPPGTPWNPEGGGIPYQFQWRMVQDGVEWFGDLTTSQTVVSYSNNLPGYYGPANQYAVRLEPANRTGLRGEDLVSGNYNWTTPVLNLAGRAGLNLSLGLAYNSLVWTRIGTAIIYDADRGFPGPGFRLGFPSIQPQFYTPQTGVNSYLAIMPSGRRVELREVGAKVYEAVDSSNLQLIEGGNGLLLRAADGSQMTYILINGEYRCTSVKDRNGNFITVDYNEFGRIVSITDTMNRVITFEYDANQRLQTIKQNRTTGIHTWATFGYTTLVVATKFRDEENKPLAVLGLPANNTISVLSQIGLDDGSRYNFDYNSWGQVYRIKRKAADGHELSAVAYNLPLTNALVENDCPRFTQRLDSAENWATNVATNFAFDPNRTWGSSTAPDGTVYKESYAPKTDYSDWRRGLTTITEVFAANPLTLKKTTNITWTQNNTTVSYLTNPRPTSLQTSDPDGNRQRTTIEYTSFGLPSDVFQWGPHGSSDWTLLRRTHTDYDLSSAYTARRIIGLVKGQYLFGPSAAPPTSSAQVLFSKTTSEDDAGGEFLQHQGSPVQFDAANYGIGLVQGRGNLTSTRRWDVNNENSISQSVASTIGYNTQGSVIFTRNAEGHQTTMSYTDAFSPNGVDITTLSWSTLAYPTTVTNPGSFSSTSKYNYDLGMVSRIQDPKGAAQTVQRDSAGRIKRITNTINNAYTRWVYPTSQTIINKFVTIKDLNTEAYSATVLDGAGQVRAVAGDHPIPNITGRYSGQFTLFDLMGRAIQQTNPVEMTNTWTAAGDDAVGSYFTMQSYDWKARPLVTTNTDNSTKEASYNGCGCAGGEQVTLTDEGTVEIFTGPQRRQKKVYSDIFGRLIKTEVLNWQGGSVYSATVNTYNVRDQITSVKQYQGSATLDGSCPSGSCQETVLTYDGHGRPSTKHTPDQNAGTATTWDYNLDDTIQKVTDARGAVSNFAYNSRNLVELVTYEPPTGIADTPNVSFGYDEAGNRTSMTDGLGSKTYSYDQLSRLMTETRIITGIGTFPLSYDYTVGGQLNKITYPGNMTINYGYDSVGRVSGVTGSDNLFLGITTYASDFAYRAWGGLKQMTYSGNQTSSFGYNSRLQVDHFEISNSVVNQNYQYYADGRIKFVDNLTDANFDRSYFYDHDARLTIAGSGGAANQQPGEVPYWETFEYDPFGHTTHRFTEVWAQDDFLDFATYLNERRNGWGYDADGRIKTIDTRQYNYDAAGRQILLTAQVWGGSFYYSTSIASAFDGDGNQVKEVSTGLVSTLTTHYLRSSALGGAIVQEINSAGQTIGYVYTPDGQLLTKQLGNAVWKQSNPIGTGLYETSLGGFVRRVEFDPVGADVPLETPPPPSGGGGDGDLDESRIFTNADALFAEMANPAAGCTLDRLFVPCDWITRLARANALSEEVLTLQRRPTKIQPGLLRSTPTQWDLGIVTRPITDIGLGLFLREERGLASNSEGAYFEMQHALFTLPQNPVPQPGSFQACVGNLGGTGFTQDAANLINKISGAEGTSRDLLAVTWMNENNFKPYPGPNTNGYNGDYKTEGYMHWDVGPFHINIGYTLAAIADGSAKWPKGADKYGVFGYTFYDPSGKTPTNTFDGVPFQNGQMAAQRLNGLGSNDRERAVNYAGQKNGPARGRSYDTWHNAFANFFKCYRGY